MFGKKQILVPIDFNEKSMAVIVNYAVPLAKRYGLKIHLLHVIEESGFFSGLFSSVDNKKIEEKLEEKLKEIAADIAEKNQLEVIPIIAKGRISTKINEIANMLNVDATVVCSTNKSTHKSNGFNSIGANTYKLIRTSERPVLVVKKPYQNSEIKTILLPIDLTPSSRQKTPHAAELAILTGASITILGGTWGVEKNTIEKKMNVVLKQVANYLSEKGIKNETVFFNSLESEKDYFKTICMYGTKHNVDVMIANGVGDSSFDYFIDGVTEYLLECSEMPILSIFSEEKGIISVPGRI